MKKYYHIITDTTNGYHDITKRKSIRNYPIVSEIDMLLDMAQRIEHKLLKANLTHRVKAIYMRYTNDLNVRIESLINY